MRTLGEKSFKRRDTVHGNQEESRQEKETLSGQMLVQEFPKASPEKHLLRGFPIPGCCGTSPQRSARHRRAASKPLQPCRRWTSSGARSWVCLWRPRPRSLASFRRQPVSLPGLSAPIPRRKPRNERRPTENRVFSTAHAK